MKPYPLLAVLVTLVLGGSIALADVGFGGGARPDRLVHQVRKSHVVPFVIDARDDVQETRLQIPRHLLRAMQTQDAAKRRGFQIPFDGRSLWWIPFGLAFMAGAAWLARRSARGPRPAFVGAAALVTAVAIGATAIANMPIRATNFVKGTTPAPQVAEGGEKVIVEIVPEGAAVKLVINRARLAQFLKSE